MLFPAPTLQQTSHDSAVLTATGQAGRLPRLSPQGASVQIPATSQRRKSQLPVHPVSKPTGKMFKNTPKTFNHFQNVETYQKLSNELTTSKRIKKVHLSRNTLKTLNVLKMSIRIKNVQTNQNVLKMLNLLEISRCIDIF